MHTNICDIVPHAIKKNCMVVFCGIMIGNEFGSIQSLPHTPWPSKLLHLSCVFVQNIVLGQTYWCTYVHNLLAYVTLISHVGLVPLTLEYVNYILWGPQQVVIFMYYAYIQAHTWKFGWSYTTCLLTCIIVPPNIIPWWVDSSCHVQAYVSVRRGIIWGFSVRGIHKGEV